MQGSTAQHPAKHHLCQMHMHVQALFDGASLSLCVLAAVAEHGRLAQSFNYDTDVSLRCEYGVLRGQLIRATWQLIWQGAAN